MYFTVFDIQDFYPSITEKLLKDALTFAQRYVEIKQNKLDLIFHTRKSLLYCNDTPWIKKKKKETKNSMLQWGAMTKLKRAIF